MIEGEAAIEPCEAAFDETATNSKVIDALEDTGGSITEEDAGLQAVFSSNPSATTVIAEPTIPEAICLRGSVSTGLKGMNQENDENENVFRESATAQVSVERSPDDRVGDDFGLKIVTRMQTCELELPDQNVGALENGEEGEAISASQLTTSPIRPDEEALSRVEIIKPDVEGQVQNEEAMAVSDEGWKYQVDELFGFSSEMNDTPMQGESASPSCEPDPCPVRKSPELTPEDSFKSDCNIAQQISKVDNEVSRFAVGDLVWAKVKSHPWWPGQIFDPADASPLAKRIRKPGRVLVAFFGDHTFGWLQVSQLMSFRQHFSMNIEQTTMKSFRNAVSEALEEVCRRVQLGLCCSCHHGPLHSASIFPDENTGIQVGTRLQAHSDISAAGGNLKPETVIEYVRGVACTPLSFWNFTLQGAEARGQVYAFRTVAFGSAYLRNMHHGRTVRRHSAQTPIQKLKRKFSDIEVASGGASVSMLSIGKKLFPDWREQPFKAVCSLTNEVKPVLENAGFWGEMEEASSQDRVRKDSGRRKGKRYMATQEKKTGRKAKKSQLTDTIRSPQQYKSESDDNSDGDTGTLVSLAGCNTKLLKKLQKGSSLQCNGKRHRMLGIEKGASSVQSSKKVNTLAPEMSKKKRALKVKKDRRVGSSVMVHSHNISTLRAHSVRAKSISEKRTRLATGITVKELKNAPNDISCNSRKLSNASVAQVLSSKELKETSASKHPSGSPMGIKCLHVQDGDVKQKQPNACPNNLQHGDGVKKSLKSLRIGECIQRVASELTGSPPGTKCMVRTSGKKAFRDAHRKSVPKKVKTGAPCMLAEVSMLKSPARGSINKHDTFGQVLQGLHLFASDPLNHQNVAKSSAVYRTILKFRDAVFLKSPGYAASALKPYQIFIDKVDVHHENLDKKSNTKGNYSKRRAHLVKGALTDLVDNSLTLASEEQKRKVKVQTENLAKRPRRGTALVPTSSVSTRLQTSVTGRRGGKNRRQSPGKKNKGYISRGTTSSSVIESKSMTQFTDIQLPSQMPVALCMKFSKNFTLPSEAELESTFIQFGVLETAGTKVCCDSGSVQVVFKHGRDAEVALNYARENALFGQDTESFWLCPFSCATSIDERTPLSGGGKEECIGEALSDVNQELTFQTSLLSNKLEIPVSVSSEGPPSSLVQVLENPDISGVPQNLSSVPTVNESSGDIKDQMIKLLQQA